MSWSLPGLNPQRVIDLKIAGDKEGDLYRMLLLAQYNALNTGMPFRTIHLYTVSRLMPRYSAISSTDSQRFSSISWRTPRPNTLQLPGQGSAKPPGIRHSCPIHPRRLC